MRGWVYLISSHALAYDLGILVNPDMRLGASDSHPEAPGQHSLLVI